MNCEKCGSENIAENEENFVCENCGAIAEKAKKGKKKQKKKKSPLGEVLDFLLPIIIALVVALLLKNFVFANAVVPTGSMLNTIEENDRIIASRLEYKFNDPERGDVIIFLYPDDYVAGIETYYVKRIIALPGETVEIVNGVTYITDTDGNRFQLVEDYITTEEPEGNFGPYVVPEGSYFVMGDNRNNSADSRYWVTTNFVDEDLIIGKVKFKYYPNFTSIE